MPSRQICLLSLEQPYLFTLRWHGQPSVQGTVTLVVVTNGDRVQSTKVVNGPSLSNIRTWTLVGKPPQTFEVTYRYVLSDRCEGNPAVKIDFPTSVAICAKPNPPLD